MTDGPVDLDTHRTIAAQRLEVIRRKQLKELQDNLSKMKFQQDALEKRLQAAIDESEEHIASAPQTSRNKGAPSAFGCRTSPTHNGNAANVNWLRGDASPEKDNPKSGASHWATGDVVRIGEEPVNLTSSSRRKRRSVATAIVYCEANFGKIDGKTANGLVRHSEKYKIIAIIDSRQAGQDAGAVLDGTPNGIPICSDLADSIAQVEGMPDCFILGMAPSSGMLSTIERNVVLDAIGLGMDIVNGLHEFLSVDDEFIKASKANNVQIFDVRMPHEKTQLKAFTGDIAHVTCPRIAVLGTDCAIGKRTTASLLTNALNDRGVKTVMVSTGQTGLIQGALYGVALDAIPSQFCAGELEVAVIAAFECEKPDLIIIEGQGALSHPAFSTSAFVLRGSQPASVILQHAPGRTHRCDFEGMVMPDPANEIRLIECFAKTRVIGLTINHENMSDEEVLAAGAKYRRELGIPSTDPLRHAPERLIEMVVKAHPHLQVKLNDQAQ
ncbi:MAG: DUF1611 domain-containing protein [Hyphomicrobiaceae bacterium]